jgi:hypothetical protein
MTNRSCSSLSSWLIAGVLGLICTMSAHAESIETCTLSGQIELKEATQILCMGDLNVADGTRILTHGQELQILAVGNLLIAGEVAVPAPHGLDIVAENDDVMNWDDNTVPAGAVTVVAHTATGYLSIHNLDGAVTLEYMTTQDYDHDIYVETATPVDILLNGYTVTAATETYKIGETQL